jgi:AAA15 family ATPase/GTPase
MITLVEALGYRSLRYISQPLGPFHVLVGPNASGKTTFLDVIAFLGRLVSDGVEAATSYRIVSNGHRGLSTRSGIRVAC